MTFQPTWVGVLRAGGPWNPVYELSDAQFAQARILVGSAEGLRWEGGPVEEIVAAIRRERWEEVPLSATIRSEAVTVAVCTRDNPDGVRMTVQSVVGQLQLGDEVLIVDNAPSSEATCIGAREMQASGWPVRYVREARRGLSRARNRALVEAQADLVLFTDDDALVDSDWVASSVTAFADPKTTIATGQAPSVATLTPSQEAFDARVRWTSAHRTIFSKEWKAPDEPGYPYSAGVFGTGANMAVRRSRLTQHGVFDVRLGAGTRTKGGEDLEMFVRVIVSGGQIVKEPRSLVWHRHKEDWRGAQRHATAYGRGLGAYAAATFLRHPGRDTVRKMLARSRGFGSVRHEAVESDPHHRRALFNEAVGVISGPVCLAVEHALSSEERRSGRRPVS